MEQTLFQNYAANRGYRFLGDVAVGVCNGYPFHMTVRSGKIDVVSAVFRLQKTAPARLVRQARRELPKNCAVLSSAGQLTLTCSGQGEELLQQTDGAMRQVTGMLREAAAQVPDTCPLCRKKGCDALALVGGYVPVHRACCQQQAYDTVSRGEVNRATGSYLTGFVGALIGGLVGSLPTLFTILVFQYMIALLYALIPLGAYFGYRKLRGRMDRGAVWLIILASVLELFLLEQLSFYLIVAMAYGIVPSPLATMSLYFQVMAPGDIAASMIPSFIFLLIGIWIVFRKISTTSQGEAADAGRCVESLQDWRGAGQNPMEF